METLVVAAQHRNRYCSRNKAPIYNQFGSSPSRGLKGINCRTLESASGFLPSPPSFKNYYESKSPHFHSEPPKATKKSNPIAISPRPTIKGPNFNEDVEEFSELWAGPAFSNSPPPSSLPIPKLSLRQKRSVSLELPFRTTTGIVERMPVAKSAPPSPKRDSVSSATENLRRILHLRITDD